MALGKKLGWVFLLILSLGPGPCSASRPTGADLLVVVANSNVSESVTVAREYASAREISEDRIVVLPMPKKLTITREEFTRKILNPLRKEIVERGLAKGRLGDAPDAFGRIPIFLETNQIRYLVLCYGVPLKIAEDNEIDDEALINTVVRQEDSAVKFTGFPKPFDKNRASVDSDLTMLVLNDAPVTGYIPNPLYGQIPAPANPSVVRVFRLDGPDLPSVSRMIRSTLKAEQIGLRGRAYFDEDGRGGAYALGNNWIRAASETAEGMGYEVDRESGGREFAAADRFDAPAIYFGWYARNVNGVFNLPDFSFSTGAIAAHLHSFSAANIRSPTQGWVGPLVARGAVATVGNVYEPYLQQTHNFEVLMKALASGMNFGDACYAAVPGLSWQSIAVGDPLYWPFLVSLDEQESMLGAPENAASDPYVVIRLMDRLLKEGKTDEALLTGIKGYYKTPGPALAIKLARLEMSAGKKDSAARRLEFAPMVNQIDAQDWVLFEEIAKILEALGRSKEATLVFSNILDDTRIPNGLRKRLLQEGAASALNAGDIRRSTGWSQQKLEIEVREREAKSK